MKYESADPYTWPASMRPSLDPAIRKSAPDVETVLAEHQRLLDGPGSCRCGDWPPDVNDVPWPAHLAAALEPLIREREAKAWAEGAEDQFLALWDGEPTNHYRDTDHREPRP